MALWANRFATAGHRQPPSRGSRIFWFALDLDKTLHIPLRSSLPMLGFKMVFKMCRSYIGLIEGNTVEPWHTAIMDLPVAVENCDGCKISHLCEQPNFIAFFSQGSLSVVCYGCQFPAKMQSCDRRARQTAINEIGLPSVQNLIKWLWSKLQIWHPSPHFQVPCNWTVTKVVREWTPL